MSLFFACIAVLACYWLGGPVHRLARRSTFAAACSQDLREE